MSPALMSAPVKNLNCPNTYGKKPAKYSPVAIKANHSSGFLTQRHVRILHTRSYCQRWCAVRRFTNGNMIEEEQRLRLEPKISLTLAAT